MQGLDSSCAGSRHRGNPGRRLAGRPPRALQPSKWSSRARSSSRSSMSLQASTRFPRRSSSPSTHQAFVAPRAAPQTWGRGI